MLNRKWLRHEIPAWAEEDDHWFITICCQVRGRNSLGWKVVHDSIVEALLAYQSQGDIKLKLLVTMPDHLHLIAQVNPSVGIRKPMECLKRYLARRHSIRWQRGFFDHRIRSGKLVRETDEYMRMNPVRAGLAKRPEDWPYRWPIRAGTSGGQGCVDKG